MAMAGPFAAAPCVKGEADGARFGPYISANSAASARAMLSGPASTLARSRMRAYAWLACGMAGGAQPTVAVAAAGASV